MADVTGGAAGEDAAIEEIPFGELAGREQPTEVRPPLPSPLLLPFNELDPEVFERVVAEVVGWRRDNRGAQFYGRRGQKQHGLDVVEHEHAGGRSLYQVKRYQRVAPKQLREAVEEYAGQPRQPGHRLPKRRFDPHRFVVVTSATVDDDTNNVDEAATLHEDYAGDIDIEVWGAERLSAMLRDSPGLVRVVFGRPWAEAFCGVTPREPTPQDPRPLGLVEEPVDVLRLRTVVADAQAREEQDPAQAATLYARVAKALEDASYPGHAALMRERQATAAHVAADIAAAFDLRFGNALDRLAGDERLWLRGDDDLAADAAALGGARLEKWRILAAAADWAEQGVDLAAVADAATALSTSGDPDAPLLCCLVLEQALVDGFFDFDPPRSLVADADADTPPRLAAVRNAAAAVTVAASDPVVRARLRCAVADSALRAGSPPADVDTAYRDLIDDANAGRFLHAAGLVASRAAYAFAIHGDVDRAETLWRRSVLASGEEGLYGDARNALWAIRASRAQAGQFMTGGFDTVVRAMPNRQRLLETRHDPSLAAFEAAQNDRLVDAFGAARRWLWQARLSGHLVDEMAAWRQFGHVLNAGGHPAASVECLVLAADPDAAGTAARPLADLADTWRWTASRNRGRRAAAVRVAAEQASLHPDDALPELAAQLLQLADGLWTSPWASPNPELEAAKAMARLGYRVAASAVDGILSLAAPAVDKHTRVSDEMADLLVQTYWAVPDRRDDLAAAIAAMLRHEQPPYGLWGLVENIPPVARDPLMPTVTDLAGAGNTAAVAALAAWRHAPADVQLTARRAVASLLRRPVGHDRDHHTLGTQDDSVVALVLALLDADDDAPVEASDLAAALCPPVGGVIMTRGPVADPDSDPAEAPRADAREQQLDDDALDPHEPDDAARVAAGPRDDVAAAVAAKLLDLAEDRRDIGGSRQRALAALLRLLPRIPGSAAAAAALRLADLHDAPGLSDDDLFEIETNTPLSRSRIDTGAAWLASTALVAAAEALSRAGDVGDPLSDDDAFADRIIAAALPLLTGTNDRAARTGARAVTAVAASHPRRALYARSLLLHPDPDVRSAGARDATLDDQLLARLAADPAPRVRAAVATRGSRLPDRLRERLAADPNAVVRHVLRHADD